MPSTTSLLNALRRAAGRVTLGRHGSRAGLDTRDTRGTRAKAAVLAAALISLIALTAGCAAASSSSSPPAASGTATAAATATPATPATTAASLAASPSPTNLAPSTPVTATVTGGPPQVYLAEGGSVTGTTVVSPGCAAGCPLSGDGTTSLWDMTWPTWSTVQAVGNGTEKIDDCNPNCAAGTLHAVKVTVALTKPVMVCVSGTGRWFWTEVTFTWPDGLPSVFSGDNAPTNPFTYPEITSQQATSCP
jgi:hypothetical protein